MALTRSPAGAPLPQGGSRGGSGGGGGSVAAAGVGLEDASLRVEGGLREAGGGVDAAGCEDAAVDQREADDPHDGEEEAWGAAPRGRAAGGGGESCRHGVSLWGA